MARNDHFVTHVLDLVERLGAASARAMFGAHGIYVDGDVNRRRFEDAGGRPFTYHD
ncbi:MAG TPA: hypothetical protein VN033_08230 [Vulgatibacter sp.]|nr:hypothetical protein [Vulgatibacter sp.]